MITSTRVLLIAVGLSLLGQLSAWPASRQASKIDRTHQIPTINASLDEAIRKISETFQLPMIVEIARPLPFIKIPAGSRTARDTLDAILKYHHQYRWELTGSTVHFYDRTLVGDSGDFLNSNLSSFTITGNLAEMELRLRAAANGAVHGIASGGMLVEGIQAPELARTKVPTVSLRDISVREVILKLQSLAPTFCAIAVFPQAQALTREQTAQALASWQWYTITEALR